MRLHPEDHTKSGLAPGVVIKPRQRLATAENFGRWHPRIVAIDDVSGSAWRCARRRAGPLRHHGATLRASRVRHPGGIRSAMGRRGRHGNCPGPHIPSGTDLRMKVGRHGIRGSARARPTPTAGSLISALCGPWWAWRRECLISRWRGTPHAGRGRRNAATRPGWRRCHRFRRQGQVAAGRH